MKLESIQIQNFRSITDLSLEFLDDLGLFRDRVPIVGPNTTGKTTILDAIALALMPITEVYQLREGLRMTPASIVRRGAIHATVTAKVWFSDEELKATHEVMRLAGTPYRGRGTVPDDNYVTVHWTYPDPRGQHRLGYYRCDPLDGWLLFRGRKVLLMNRHAPRLNSRGFQNLGHVVMFDQQRTGLAKTLSPRERALLGQMIDPDLEDDAATLANDEPLGIPEPRRGSVSPVETSDPRLILTSLAMRAQVRQDEEATEKEDYLRLCDLYARVCRPHKIKGLFNTDHGLDMEFVDGKGDVYYYDGLSSGQQMILLLLLQFTTRRIHRSIVLIDELELHLHPLWQDRLYESLGDLGTDNQFIFTTHSTHLRDTLQQPYIATGDLTVKT